ncbi:hypothetical protein D3C80_2179240 [compost metagenome]
MGTVAYLHTGGVQAIGGAYLLEIQRLGLAAFRDDQDAVMARTLALLALQILLLTRLG